ncbi:hypothetical protein Sinac_7226 [Singulisphaera acidiphila DSM 18658]|uniref:Uncharacterized protein n=1 Tax=Singulisphaera acidiphila (strain ATCC BAA-1392 / DSM 18658 / VKM B-2454 / MOB10) TaxID=886293 RepID=L0DPH8_SINAD|nr:hypothetical protein Sinac_7226 [Singulisphaera acidiphila DSM 18658]
MGRDALKRPCASSRLTRHTPIYPPSFQLAKSLGSNQSASHTEFEGYTFFTILNDCIAFDALRTNSLQSET